MRRLYWRVCKPVRRGVKVFVFNNERVLLVRLGYGKRKYALPGGGVERGEFLEDAAVREVLEESGIIITEPKYIGSRTYTTEYKTAEVAYFHARTEIADITIDGQEIIDAGWFTLQELPELNSVRLKEEIQAFEEFFK